MDKLKQFAANWKTSTLGLIGAIMVGLSQQQALENGGAKEWGTALVSVAVPLLFGYFAKDADQGEPK